MAATYKDYYEVLGINRKATADEIKVAYRKAARKHHPDLHIKSEKAAAEEKFKDINEAYEVLGDPEKRAKYDQLGEDRRNGQAGPTPANQGEQDMGHWSQVDSDGFSDFFESLFGRQTPRGYSGDIRQQNRPGQNLESEISLTLEEAYQGGQKMLQFSLRERCLVCSGTGVDNRNICQSCGGTGYKTSVKALDVQIPVGVREGSKIRLRGQGGSGTGNGGRGDLLLTVRFQPHALFSINGNRLETTVKIRPEQAVLGSRIPVPTLDGEVMITVPPMTHNGQKLRLRAKGWPGKDGIRGDQYVGIAIDIPRFINQSERDLYQQLAGQGNEVQNP